MATVVSTHIEVGEDGIARIAGTRTKVALVIEDYLDRGWGPETIRENYPDLSLAQIHAAFVYYYDHQAEFDVQLARRRRETQQARDVMPETPGRTKLRETGLRP